MERSGIAQFPQQSAVADLIPRQDAKAPAEIAQDRGVNRTVPDEVAQFDPAHPAFRQKGAQMPGHPEKRGVAAIGDDPGFRNCQAIQRGQNRVARRAPRQVPRVSASATISARRSSPAKTATAVTVDVRTRARAARRRTPL